MQVLVNALSANHPSARHVLYGHLRQLALWTANEHEFVVVIPTPKQAAAQCSRQVMPVDLPNVRTVTAPCGPSSTLRRGLWERCFLARVIRREGADLYFTPAGTVLPACPVPQVSLAQNPWCMVQAVPKSLTEKLRAGLQRCAYARAQSAADLMVYNSRYMRDLYRANHDVAPRESLVAYQAIDAATHESASALANRGAHRQASTIVAVSFMAPWKGADQLVRCLAELRNQGIDALLRLVGPWADPSYERHVRGLVAEHKLESQVTITGRVPREQLHQEMASARVFALPSRCESFGIPAVEAQAFGTPVVGSNTTAMAEIGGAGGHFCHPDDLGQLTDAIARLLTDDQHWERISDAARENAARYRWEICSKPLLRMFDLTGDRRVG